MSIYALISKQFDVFFIMQKAKPLIPTPSSSSDVTKLLSRKQEADVKCPDLILALGTPSWRLNSSEATLRQVVRSFPILIHQQMSYSICVNQKTNNEQDRESHHACQIRLV